MKIVTHYLNGISGIEIFPIIGFIMFFAFFLSLLYYLYHLDKGFVKDMSETPFEDDSLDRINSLKK